MPKLVYFPLKGRALAIQLMLRLKGVEYEEVTLNFQEWGAAKQAGTYGAGNQLPIWVTDDGRNMT